MSELLKINVSEHVEKKNGLSYLSWAWAWAEVLKIDPTARWHVVEYDDEHQRSMPAMFLPDGSAMVRTEVTIKGETRMCMLPVMNHRNQAIKNPDAFAINTAIMRCMTKAISMHGLGLYIYAGEDLPEGEDDGKAKPKDIAHSGPAIIFSELQPEVQDHLRRAAPIIVKAMPDTSKAIELIEQTLDDWPDDMRNEVKAGLWSLLDSKTRSAIKAHKEQ